MSLHLEWRSQRKCWGVLAFVGDEKSPLYKYSEESMVGFLQKGHEKGAGRRMPVMARGSWWPAGD